ncbi:MAG: hypothetical protein OXL37_05480 [Chloroflexota bacterium]|nr:hypothetical protein [Chloroflexota bacterium]MDE2961034.1 hypothetical protein [Chloroflexota bacterium]
MRYLQIAWLSLLSIGVGLVYVDVLYRVLLEIQGIPALIALGVALILLALTSMLNWLFKEAWEEHRSSAQQNGEGDPTG